MTVPADDFEELGEEFRRLKHALDDLEESTGLLKASEERLTAAKRDNDSVTARAATELRDSSQQFAQLAETAQSIIEQANRHFKSVNGMASTLNKAIRSLQRFDAARLEENVDQTRMRVEELVPRTELLDRRLAVITADATAATRSLGIVYEQLDSMAQHIASWDPKLEAYSSDFAAADARNEQKLGDLDTALANAAANLAANSDALRDIDKNLRTLRDHVTQLNARLEPLEFRASLNGQQLEALNATMTRVARDARIIFLVCLFSLLVSLAVVVLVVAS